MKRPSTSQPFNVGDGLDPDDDGSDCVNKPLYKCKEKVPRAGAICSLCRIRTTECSVIHTHTHPSCSNTRTILTLVKNLKRLVGDRLALYPNGFYIQDGTQIFKEDADYNEGDPQVLVHDPSRPGDE